MGAAVECPICSRLAKANDAIIAEFEESVAVVADTQGYAGWCIVLLKEHVEHLAELPIARQEKLFGEVARVPRRSGRFARRGGSIMNAWAMKWPTCIGT